MTDVFLLVLLYLNLLDRFGVNLMGLLLRLPRLVIIQILDIDPQIFHVSDVRFAVVGLEGLTAFHIVNTLRFLQFADIPRYYFRAKASATLAIK